jgi:hypothetical protein
MKAKIVKRSAPAPPTAEESMEIQFSEQVAALAYALWEASGRLEGTAEKDWYRAEQTLTENR